MNPFIKKISFIFLQFAGMYFLSGCNNIFTGDPTLDNETSDHDDDPKSYHGGSSNCDRIGVGVDGRPPLGYVITGGLILSQIITLFVTLLIYLTEKAKGKIQIFFRSISRT